MTLDFSEHLKAKKKAQRLFFKQFQLPKTNRATVYIDMVDEKLKDDIKKACSAIDVFCVEVNENFDFFAIDAIITDAMEAWKLSTLCKQNLIIPVVFHSYEVFSEFNPMKFEGNAFLFQKQELFSVFEKICRFLENGQYPWDRRVLLKNIFVL